ncbi:MULTISPECIES: hypothetical protein [Paenibacillus]|uniref:Uncharacterized protein n=1 Tax=Paenibacillus alvei TaxID=44250 RepID=A0ABT4E855_PAEAL|nr:MULTISPECIES: hypothetical protein [Paenibacillus]MCY9529235.1 hypothetical protein [Paenibacillus alvei]SDF26039.1 hypothetical protein SAMN04488689_104114 [Paenibacillus sp. cl6col]
MGNPDGDKDDEGNPDDADLGGKTDSKKPNAKRGVSCRKLVKKRLYRQSSV